MDDRVEQARHEFIQGMSRIASFWNFPRGLGAVFGAVYLSPEPVGLDALVEESGVSKGAVSTHVRHLERIGLVHKRFVKGDRRDYYEAETDFWKAIRMILKEREKAEFDQALAGVEHCLAQVAEAREGGGDSEELRFLEKRLSGMNGFFKSLDKLVGAIIALDDLRNSTLGRLFKG